MHIYLLVALFAIGIGALGCAIFMYFVKMEQKKALILGVAGLLFISGAIVSNKFRPAYEKETTIIVQDTIVPNEKNKNDLYSCNVNDPYSSYVYLHKDKSKVEEFCSQFTAGESYDIKYRYKSGIYTILEVKEDT